MSKTLPCLPKPDKKSGIYHTTWTNHYPPDHPTQPGKPFTDYMSFETKDLDRANERYIKFLTDRTKTVSDAGAGRRTVHWCLDYYQANRLDNGKVTSTRHPKAILAMWKKYFPATKMAHEINKVDPLDPDAELDTDRWERLRRTDRQMPVDKATGKIKKFKKDGTPRSKKPLTDNTIRTELKKLTTVINFCIKKGVLSNLNRPIIEIGKPGKGRLGHIDEDQFAKLMLLLEAANSPRTRVHTGALPGIAIWAAVMFMTGCRPNEAKFLKWGKVDLDRKREIDFTLDDRPETCKTRNSEAPIPDALLAILRRARAEAKTEWVCVEPVTFEPTFVACCEKAGFPVTGPKRITAHSMRHSRITLAVASGMEAGEASDLFKLDIKTMMDTYYHGTAARRAENANRSMDQKKLMRASIKAVK